MGRSRWRWRWRRGALHQRSYAVEGAALLAIGSATLGGAAWAAAETAGAQLDAAQEARQHHHAATATMLGNSPTGEATGLRTVRAHVRWTAPDGTSRTGTTTASAGTVPGSSLRVWTDDRGNLVAAPVPAAQATARAAAIGAGTAVGITLFGGAACGGVTALAQRHRTRQWAAVWAEVGPRWTHWKA